MCTVIAPLNSPCAGGPVDQNADVDRPGVGEGSKRRYRGGTGRMEAERSRIGKRAAELCHLLGVEIRETPT